MQNIFSNIAKISTKIILSPGYISWKSIQI